MCLERVTEIVTNGKGETKLALKASRYSVENGRFSAEEVAKHKEADDCWLIANGQVYDATPFLEIHPGGPCILKRGGQDATRDYEFHSKNGRKTWKRYHIGTLDTEPTHFFGKVMNGLLGK